MANRTDYENAPGLPTLKMTFCESGENHQVGTDFIVRSNRCRIPADECLNRRRLAAVALLDEVINPLAGGVIHLHVEGFYLAGEVVEGHNGRDGNQKAERGGD